MQTELHLVGSRLKLNPQFRILLSFQRSRRFSQLRLNALSASQTHWWGLSDMNILCFFSPKSCALPSCCISFSILFPCDPALADRLWGAIVTCWNGSVGGPSGQGSIAQNYTRPPQFLLEAPELLRVVAWSQQICCHCHTFPFFLISPLGSASLDQPIKSKWLGPFGGYSLEVSKKEVLQPPNLCLLLFWEVLLVHFFVGS